MSMDMSGIDQGNLFSRMTSMSVIVGENSKYRILSEILPWSELARVANEHRGQKVRVDIGRSLNLRAHLGALIVQSMNNLTDRMTEELVRYHAGVRLLCGFEESTQSIDHTSIEKFRNSLGPAGVEAINHLMVQAASEHGFTGSGLCSSDTTAQQSPIAYPTEVGHLKNIADKLADIGKRIKKGLKDSIDELAGRAKKIFREIRLFTRGKGEKVQEKKKKLSKKLQKTVATMCGLVQEAMSNMGTRSKAKYQEQMELYGEMIDQIKHWLETGFHPKNKWLSLWEKQARSINRGKIAKAVEFGRRWIVSRLFGGYVIGSPVTKLGGGNDVEIADEVLIDFLNVFGEAPETFVYDRGGDGPKNHELLKDMGIKNNCIFLKGRARMNIDTKTYKLAKRERALSEASIATIKHSKYGFDKPRAKTTPGCMLKGHMAILGANMNKFFNDTMGLHGLAMEIG